MSMSAKRPVALAAAVLLASAGLLAATWSAAAAEVLITEAEAKLPTQKGAIAATSRGITRGPRIELVDVPKDGAVQSPMHLQLKFQAFGGAKVDPSAVQVTYLKTPAVDLTSRIKPFVQDSGIDMPDAVLPPGEHPLRIDIKDSDGRTGTTNFVLKVGP